MDEFDLSRNFGFDITMSSGNMGMPAAAHQDYMARCNFLYKEFLSNMNVLIKEEKEMKKTLQGLYKEKIRNLRYSLYRSEEATDINNHDPFAKKQDLPPISPLWESRGNTPWGLDPIADEEERNLARPQTAPALQSEGTRQDTEELMPEARPQTAGVLKLNIHDDETAGKGASDMTQASEIVGVLDTNSERTSCRKIIVGKNSFAKVSVQETNIKLKNRDGRFHVKPMKDNFVQEKMGTVAYDPSQAYKNYDPVNEKVALVRQITSYKTPTIASDMKINNRVPIQKSLRGESAKRITVEEIYRNARDRKARHFKLIIRTPKEESEGDKTDSSGNKSLLSVNSWPFLRSNSKAKNFQDVVRNHIRQTHSKNSFRENTPIISPLPMNDLTTSALSAKFKTCQNRNENGENIESQVQRDSCQENAEQNNSNRPTFFGVAFAETKSDIGKNESENHHKDNKDFNSGRNRRGSILKPDRSRRLSEVSKATEISAAFTTGTTNEIMDSSEPRLESRAVPVVPRNGRRSMSIVSIASAGSFIVKLKNAVNDKSKDTEAELSFRPPPKLQTRRDSTKIVEQHLQKDKQLDERMAIWQRRMVKARVSPGRGVLSPRKRNGRL